MRRASSRSIAALLLVAACGRGEAEPADPLALRLPTGALLSPDGAWLFVANSNLDLEVQTSTLVSIDLRALDRAFAEEPGPEGSALSGARPCRLARDLDEDVVECEARSFLQREHSVRLPSGAGNIALDLPIGDEGPWRLLIPSSLDRSVTWVDVLRGPSGIEVDCDQDAEGECDEGHVMRRLGGDGSSLPTDAGRITVDPVYRYAYLPHLLGANMTLIALDAEYGPMITDIAGEFFDTYPSNNEQQYMGGFAVVRRACDPAEPAAGTEGCTRPLLYAAQRFFPGVRLFTVETGRDDLIRFGAYRLEGVNIGEAGDRPFMGGLEFEDPEEGERLLIVHTTPPALARVDTRLRESGVPINDTLESVALCENPNVLAVSRPPGGEAMAFISCYSADAVAAVALGSFQVVATIDVDDGPNELIVDQAREKLLVVHTLAHTVGVVELDRKSPRYLTMIRRIGLRG